MSTPKPSAAVINPYLNFNGRCEEAVEFYKSALGAQVEMMLRFKDNPEPQSGEGCGPAAAPDKIMHVSFKIGNSLVMASDCEGTGTPTFAGVSLSLSLPTEAEADRAFAALSDGGQVHMPLTKTFFSPKFGVLADRFGVSWMILVTPAAPAA